MQRLLFRTRLFAIGEFHCPPGHPRWEGVNRVGESPTIAFPGTSVVIQHLGAEPVLANPNHVIFYNAEQAYRRELRDERGDHCVFFELSPELLRAALGSDELPFTHAPAPAKTFLAAHGALRSGDPLEAEELGLEAVRETLATGTAFHRIRRGAARKRTRHEHQRLADDAKELLTERVAERLTLADVAQILHTSEFHLARVFHDRTGFTLHSYRTHLRLRLALDHLASGCTDLTTVAAELGFSSHAHFTRAFKELFGSPPSVVRSAFRLRELRRIVEAPLLARS